MALGTAYGSARQHPITLRSNRERETEMESIQDAASTRSSWPIANVYSALAVMSLAAAGIHFAVTGEHFEEYMLFGVFFAIIAWFQALWALGVVITPSAWVLALGFMVNAQIAWVWLISRTVGLPIGPQPGVAEPAAFLDVLSTVIELSVAAVCAALLYRGRSSRQPVGMRGRALRVGAVTLGLMLLSTIALAVAGGHGHGHVGRQMRERRDQAVAMMTKKSMYR
jgi:hypothetical protein